jgi:hypothetical protein
MERDNETCLILYSYSHCTHCTGKSVMERDNETLGDLLWSDPDANTKVCTVLTVLCSYCTHYTVLLLWSDPDANTKVLLVVLILYSYTLYSYCTNHPPLPMLWSDPDANTKGIKPSYRGAHIHGV